MNHDCHCHYSVSSSELISNFVCINKIITRRVNMKIFILFRFFLQNNDNTATNNLLLTNSFIYYLQKLTQIKIESIESTSRSIKNGKQSNPFVVINFWFSMHTKFFELVKRFSVYSDNITDAIYIQIIFSIHSYCIFERNNSINKHVQTGLYVSQLVRTSESMHKCEIKIRRNYSIPM